jgi:hypothetical protein
LEAQFFARDGQMPTVYPAQFFDLEFTEKIAPHEALAIPVPFGVYRLDGAPRARSRRFSSHRHRASNTVRDQEEAFGPDAAHPAVVRQPYGSLCIQKLPSPSVRFVTDSVEKVGSVPCSPPPRSDASPQRFQKDDDVLATGALL